MVEADTEPRAVVKPGLYVLQAGSFTRFEDADRRRAELALQGMDDAGDLTEQIWHEVHLRLGSPDNRMVFVPDRLTFETGKYYALVIENAGPALHEFDAPALLAAVYTKHVKVYGKDGNMIAELYGAPGEIEVAPGGKVEWYFVPVRTVEAGEMICDAPGHLQAGMKGTVTIR